MARQPSKPILAGPAKDAADRAALSERYSQRQIERAYKRLQWLNCWLEALRDRRHGETDRGILDRIVREAKKTEGDDFKISARSLQAWATAASGVRRGNRVTRVIRGVEALISPYVESKAASCIPEAKAVQAEPDRDCLGSKYTPSQICAAYRRLRWLREWLASRGASLGVSATDLARQIVDQARRMEGIGFSISVRSLQQWDLAFRRGGVEALIPRRVGRDEKNRSAEAIRLFKKLLKAGYNLRKAHDETLAKARAQGWLWPSSYGATEKWASERGVRMNSVAAYVERCSRASRSSIGKW